MLYLVQASAARPWGSPISRYGRARPGPADKLKHVLHAPQSQVVQSGPAGGIAGRRFESGRLRGAGQQSAAGNHVFRRALGRWRRAKCSARSAGARTYPCRDAVCGPAAAPLSDPRLLIFNIWIPFRKNQKTPVVNIPQPSRRAQAGKRRRRCESGPRRGSAPQRFFPLSPRAFSRFFSASR